jgi:hypothetical protein
LEMIHWQLSLMWMNKILKPSKAECLRLRESINQIEARYSVDYYW